MYGPTFSAELKAAGLADLQFAWCPDGSLLFDESLTQEQRAAIEAVAAAHNPNAPEPVIEAKKQKVRAMREAVLNRLVGIAMAAQLTGDQATVGAYLIARQGLLDLTKDLPEEPESVELVMFGRYQAIVHQVQQTAPALITAFAGVDA